MLIDVSENKGKDRRLELNEKDQWNNFYIKIYQRNVKKKKKK